MNINGDQVTGRLLAKEIGNAFSRLVARRRLLVAAGAIPSFALARPARAAELAGQDDLLDGLRIADLIQRERGARDAGDFDGMAACWRSDADVDISWYKGDGAGFVARSRRNAATGRISVHQLTPSVVTVAGDRAIAETPCQLVSFVPVDGVDVCMTGVVRLLWRVRRQDGRWLLAGLRVVYVRDYLVPVDPSRPPTIDGESLRRYRASYRFLSYILARSPNPPRDDLPGIDRPETVSALRSSQVEWLRGT